MILNHASVYRSPAVWCGLAGTLLLAGCGVGESTWRTYEEVTVEATASSTPAAMPMMGQPAGAPAAGDLNWTAPAGWREEAGSGMRLASFGIGSGATTGACTIITLSGAAGGLEANVRRWIGQLELDELPADELSAFLDRQEKFQSEGGFEVIIVDLTELGDPSAEDSSMLAASIRSDGSTLFVKLTGPVALLRQEKAAFTGLCRSVRKTT